MAMLNFSDFFAKDDLFAKEHFSSDNPFSYLGKSLTEWLTQLLQKYGVTDSPVIKGSAHPGAFISGPVYIAEGAHVEPTAMISGPCFIGPGSEVRHGAYIRGSVYAGRNTVIGHTTEVKGSVFLDDAKAGHFAYVGDSILGRSVNLGAGTKLANLKLRGDTVWVNDPNSDQKISSGLRKMGAIVGDESQTGCNAVLSPGTLLMPSTAVMACVHYLGTLKAGIARGPK